MSDNKIVAPTRRAVLAGAAAALPLLSRRARAADPISIGWVGPLSPPGGYAEGTNMKNAAEIAAAEINAQGGILGRQVEITYADTRGMPAEGRTSAERLIQQNKVVAVFGEFHSPVAMSGLIRSLQRATRRCSATRRPCR
jgi:branched-chain amino acid transport system substrate-binding protein